MMEERHANVIGETTKCIICLEDAKVHTGHVLKPDGSVLAGWCKEHEDVYLKTETKRVLYLNNKTGCYGGWLETYGFKSFK